MIEILGAVGDCTYTVENVNVIGLLRSKIMVKADFAAACSFLFNSQCYFVVVHGMA